MTPKEQQEHESLLKELSEFFQAISAEQLDQELKLREELQSVGVVFPADAGKKD